MPPSVPIFPVYNFFQQNIWHSIFDQFHFHHIFGDEMSVIRQDRQQTTDTLWRTMTVKSSRNILGTSWMVMRERSFKYLGAQQVSQQISIFFKSKGLASYCKAETTFTFHLSILTLTNAFLSIDNSKMKSESVFSLAMASQPFWMD